MNANELENNKILLEDARQAFNSRLSHFSNLTSKAGILLAVEGLVITTTYPWLSNKHIYVLIKVAFILLMAYAAYNCIRSMFVKKLDFIGIQAGVMNLATNPSMTTIQWVKHLINEYNGLLAKIHTEYDKRNNWLREAVIIIAIAILVYSISSIIGV
jgi:hypothetical protein